MTGQTFRSAARAVILTVLFGCAASGPPTRPNDREWNALLVDHKGLETLRTSAPQAPAGASRKKQIEALLEAQKKTELVYSTFMEKLGEYHERTGDPRAAGLLASEKILLGDQYMYVLARYDRAINMYQSALGAEPTNALARQRLEEAQKKRFVSMDLFVTVRVGMKETEVQQMLGMPREDWIKQVVQKNKVYTVWIYPKQDGSASAIYFENGVVYHTNWNAAPAKAK